MPRGVVTGLPARTCALPNCGQIFAPTKRCHLYCCPAHRFQAHDAQQFLESVAEAVVAGQLHITLDGRRCCRKVRAAQALLL